MGPIPVWELRNKDQEEGLGPLVIGDPRRDIVIHLQTALLALGIYTGALDGILGNVRWGRLKSFRPATLTLSFPS